MWSLISRDSDLGMIMLTRANINCKRQTRHLVREGAPTNKPESVSQ
jgi:hypothetical protein